MRVRRATGAPRPASGANDRYVRGVGCERSAVTDVAGENRPARLGNGDGNGDGDRESIDGRSPRRCGPPYAGPASEVLGDVIDDVAG
jgi:hypothetical protein